MKYTVLFDQGFFSKTILFRSNLIPTMVTVLAKDLDQIKTIIKVSNMTQHFFTKGQEKNTCVTCFPNVTKEPYSKIKIKFQNRFSCSYVKKILF